MFRSIAILLIGVVGFSSQIRAAGVPTDCRQLIVATSPSWDSSRGSLQRFERDRGKWTPVGTPIPVLFGKNGLAWGIGVAGQDESGAFKVERDKRAPAGVFSIGKIYTANSALPAGSDFPFHTITKADAWIDDPSLPEYNRHVTVDPASPPPWFEKQRMRHGDFAYEFLVEIRHNSDPPVAGRGSAIFFHIRRGETRPTSGCTTMARSDLVELIRWLRAEAHPHYVLLPATEYAAREKRWNLPPLAVRG